MSRAVTFRVSDELYDQLKKMSESNHVTISKLIQELLKDYTGEKDVNKRLSYLEAKVDSIDKVVQRIILQLEKN